MKDSSFRDRVVDVMEEFYKLLGIVCVVLLAGSTLNYSEAEFPSW